MREERNVLNSDVEIPEVVLKKADDAIELDTSNMTLEEVVDQVLTLINKTREE